MYGWTLDYVETLSILQLHEAALAAYMLRNTDLSQDLTVAMLPHIKNESKRAKIIKQANKNSEVYLQKSDNEVITMESIFAKLSKGFKSGR